MSYFLRIFCRSGAAVTRDEIARFVNEGVYFDRRPRYDPAPGSTEARAPEWKSLQIEYAPRRRPVVIHRDVGTKPMGEEVEEVATRLARAGAPAGVLEHIRAARQVLAVELDQQGASEEVWQMVDSLEADLARRLDGVVYAPDDGVYGPDLQPLFKF